MEEEEDGGESTKEREREMKKESERGEEERSLTRFAPSQPLNAGEVTVLKIAVNYDRIDCLC